MSGDISVARVLLAHGANINHVNANGVYVLSLAECQIQQTQNPIAATDFSAESVFAPQRGGNVLHVVGEEANLETINILQRFELVGLHPEIYDDEGQTSMGVLRRRRVIEPDLQNAFSSLLYHLTYSPGSE